MFSLSDDQFNKLDLLIKLSNQTITKAGCLFVWHHKDLGSETIQGILQSTSISFVLEQLRSDIRLYFLHWLFTYKVQWQPKNDQEMRDILKALLPQERFSYLTTCFDYEKIQNSTQLQSMLNQLTPIEQQYVFKKLLETHNYFIKDINEISPILNELDSSIHLIFLKWLVLNPVFETIKILTPSQHQAIFGTLSEENKAILFMCMSSATKNSKTSQTEGTPQIVKGTRYTLGHPDFFINQKQRAFITLPSKPPRLTTIFKRTKGEQRCGDTTRLLPPDNPLQLKRKSFISNLDNALTKLGFTNPLLSTPSLQRLLPPIPT